MQPNEYLLLKSPVRSPLNQDNAKFCHNCRTPIALLRNQYRPIRFLGSGGFGRTFLAENIDKFNEQCVIKQLVPQVQGTWATQKAKELFEQEAKKLQKLGEHPQIPSLTAYFEQDNYWYIVQQFIEGQTLYQELQQKGVFAEEQIRKVLQELLEILKFIHQSPVIHRDLKPENVMRRHSDRKLVLIDFGIAKELAQTTFQAKSKHSIGTTIGSFGYSPLEQLQGGQAYPASDLYSLGAICFHLLSGIHPYQLWQEHGYGWTADWQKQITTPISQPLARILTKLLQKDYQQRYQNADQVLADLNLKIPDSTVPSPPPQRSTSSTAKGNSPNSSNQVKALLMSILLALPIGIVIYQMLQARLPIDSETFLESQMEQFATQEPQNINYSQPISTQTLSVGSSVQSIAISPDGKTIVSFSMDNTIKIWDRETGQLQSTLNGHEDFVGFSPNGKIVSFSMNNSLKLIEMEAERIQSLTEHKDSVNSVAISADGKTIVSLSKNNTIEIWDLKTGQSQSTDIGDIEGVNSVAISPDGKTIASGSWLNNIKIWDLKTEQLQSTLTGHKDGVSSVAISADGKTIVSGSRDDTIKIWDLKTGELQSTLTGHKNGVSSVAISADGKTIISGSYDKTIKIWDLATGELESTLTGHQDGVYSVAISADGNTIASGSRDETIKIWSFE